MKKIGLGILIVITVLAVAGVAVAISNQSADIAKEKTKAPDLEKIEFIHWKKGFTKPPCDNDGICEPESGENPSCADCKKEEEPAPAPTCYAFMGKYGKRFLKWGELPVNYVINPNGFSESFVTGAISAGAEEWGNWTSADLFGSYSIDETATYRVQNYVNAISFGDYYSDPDIIAAATVWYSPATKTIVEFDIIFETNYTWGDATLNPSVMDLQNIATHELGHGVGLADIYETECSEVTMYGYSGYGETQKRTLETPDITGIQILYGDFNY